VQHHRASIQLEQHPSPLPSFLIAASCSAIASEMYFGCSVSTGILITYCFLISKKKEVILNQESLVEGFSQMVFSIKM
jgi:hypothetical protein